MIKSINNFFDKIYILNLKRDISKRNKISQQFDKLDLSYTFFDACNGYSSKYEREWQFYQNRPKSTPLEVNYNKKFIESQGALGYLKSMSTIFKQSLQFNYNRILVFDDDTILCDNFFQKFTDFIDSLPTENWKVILLGASQYKWDFSIGNKYYLPQKLKTFGSFAVGYDRSIFYELYLECNKLESPFDNVPLGKIYDKYKNQCFVSYPNIAIADVSKSLIRAERNMEEHSKKMKWVLEDFNFEVE